MWSASSDCSSSLLLVNRKELMGDYTNSSLANVIAWGTSITIIVLTIALTSTTAMGHQLRSLNPSG